MIPLSAPTGASQEGSAPFGDKEPRSDKEKDKGEKSNREKSATQGQATGTLRHTSLRCILLNHPTILQSAIRISNCLLLCK